MSLDAVTALARLLSDRAEREAFLADRAAWAEQVEPEGRETILELDAEELGGQARLLIDKRRGECAGFLERTIQELGPRYAPLFQEYADASPWPTGHLRHLHDALGFLAWLTPREPRAVSGVDYTLLHAHLNYRNGKKLSLKICHHRDLGLLSLICLTVSLGTSKLRLAFPLPFPGALGRRLFWPRSAAPRLPAPTARLPIAGPTPSDHDA